MLWHLLLFMFNYDYTLEEGGVESSAETNQQVSFDVVHQVFFYKTNLVCVYYICCCCQFHVMSRNQLFIAYRNFLQRLRPTLPDKTFAVFSSIWRAVKFLKGECV